MAIGVRFVRNRNAGMPWTQCSDIRVCGEGRAWRRAAFLLAAAVLALASGVARAQPATPSPMSAPVPLELYQRATAPDPSTRLAAVAPLRDLGTPAAWTVVVWMLQRDVDAHYTPLQWIKEMTPVITWTMLLLGGLIYLEGALLRWL